ncbi:MAG: DUF91 domain-containing protein [Actinobacteria bacterium]|nr:MAG: DUF91 domain-containing protein [Actinomycetota bacterium]
MTLETGFWRIDGGTRASRISPTSMDFEARLEAILEADISVVSEPRKWMIIGRQIPTDHGGFIDLLAIDETGNLIVLELKRDKTDRQVVSQLLDYASWVDDLSYEDVGSIFVDYQAKWRGRSTAALEDAFQDYFGVSIPEEVNRQHEMIIVAAELHPESERVVRYLQKNYDVPVNAVFFSFFIDGEGEYLSRSWLAEPSAEDGAASRKPGRWNGEYYVSFDYPKDVVRAGLEYGFFVAGGGSWYTKSMDMLSVGDRVWVYLGSGHYANHKGFVGVAEVLETRQPVDDFLVTKNGKQVPVTELTETRLGLLSEHQDEPEMAEYAVRLRWLHKVPDNKAVYEKGFFANQNTVARPTASTWDYTIKRLRTLWSIEDE